MIINDILKEKNMTRYKLSKDSGVPMSTIADICNQKTSLEKCTVGTLSKICNVLNISIDELLKEERKKNEYRMSFETFKSNVCHRIKDTSQVSFIIEILENDYISLLYSKEWYPESFYLLAMLDYLSRLNDLPLCDKYDGLRLQTLTKTIYPEGILIEAKLFNDETIKKKAFDNSIPEFKRFNIVENEVFNVA